jgi:hypothetical protein
MGDHAPGTLLQELQKYQSIRLEFGLKIIG